MILLIFKVREIQNIGFVRNLSLYNSCEFYYDDVTVTFVNDKYGDAVAERIPSGTAFRYSFSLGKKTLPKYHSL